MTKSSRDESLFGAAVLVDKPAGWSSFAVVRQLRAATGIKKVGHAGSLDPMATGLLVCCLGRPATRHVTHFTEMKKEYEGRMRLGEVTPSHDAETQVTERAPIDEVTLESVRAAAGTYVGTFQQRPPMYSAVKVEGEPLYKKARRGESAERPPRVITVYSFDIQEQSGPEITFRVTCSKGTYVRSLVHDLGQDIGVGAHLTYLRRLAIGPYRVDDAWSVERLEQALASGILTIQSES